MKIIVDTNIVFSAILNSGSTIGSILLRTHRNLRFYSCNYLREELKNHRGKLRKITKLSFEELVELEEIVVQKITFMDERLIPKTLLEAAGKRLQGIDENDTVFVALTDLLQGKLWTGDKQLHKGLSAQSWESVLSTEALLLLLQDPNRE